MEAADEAHRVIQFEDDQFLTCAAFSPSGKYLFVGIYGDDGDGKSGLIEVDDPTNKVEKPLKRSGLKNCEPNPGITCAAFSGDKKFLAVGGDDSKVFVYPLDEDQRPEPGKYEILQLGGEVRCVAFATVGAELRLAVASGDGVITIYKHEEGSSSNWRLLAERARSEDIKVGIRSLAFSSTGKQLVAGGDDKQVAIYEMDKFLKDDPCPCVTIERTKTIRTVFFNHQQADADALPMICVGGKDKTFSLHRQEKLGCKPKFHCSLNVGYQVNVAALSHDNKLIVVGSEGRALSVYDNIKARLVKKISLSGCSVSDVAFSRGGDGKSPKLAVTCEDSLHIIDTSTFKGGDMYTEGEAVEIMGGDYEGRTATIRKIVDSNQDSPQYEVDIKLQSGIIKKVVGIGADELSRPSKIELDDASEKFVQDVLAAVKEEASRPSSKRGRDEEGNDDAQPQQKRPKGKKKDEDDAPQPRSHIVYRIAQTAAEAASGVAPGAAVGTAVGLGTSVVGALTTTTTLAPGLWGILGCTVSTSLISDSGTAQAVIATGAALGALSGSSAMASGGITFKEFLSSCGAFAGGTRDLTKQAMDTVVAKARIAGEVAKERCGVAKEGIRAATQVAATANSIP